MPEGSGSGGEDFGFLLGGGEGGVPGQDSFEATNSLLSSTATVPLPESGSEEFSGDQQKSAAEDALGGINIIRKPKHSLNSEEWTSAVCAIVGSSKAAPDALAMFQKMDHTRSNFVIWSNVLDLFMGKMAPTTAVGLANKTQPLTHDEKFRASQHSKRETIAKIIGVSSGTTYVYIVISKYGHVGIYDEKFRLQRKYDIDIDTDPNSDFDVAASDPGWVTDGLWMDNSKHAVYTTSLRTMHFYDASASVHYEEYRAFGFRSIPTCVDYSFNKEDPENEALLLFGDAAGGLSIVHFSQPLNSLFDKDEVDNVQCLFWPDMEKHAEFARIDYFPKLHSDGILGIKYLVNNNTVITISRDPNASLVIRQVNRKFDSYIFKLGWGVRCFDHRAMAGLSLVVTGSNDKIVRLWNPVVTAKPTSILVGHKAGINDVRIHAERRLIFSYDKVAVLKVWDIHFGNCLQTLLLHFPSFEILGKEVEFGKPALYIDTASKDLIVVTCCEHFTCIDLNDEYEDDYEETRDTTEDNAGNVPEAEKRFHAAAAAAAAAVAIAGTRDETAMPPLKLDDKAEMEKFEPILDDFLKSLQRGLDTDELYGRRKKDPQVLSPGRQSDKTSTATTSGWSSTRSVIKKRVIGKAFAKGHDAVEDSSHFRLFKEKFDTSNDGESSLNVLRVRKYLNNTRMKELARDNMPFMALEIHGLEEITLSQNLPHTVNMVQRGVNIRNMDDLINMRLDLMGVGSSSHSKLFGSSGGVAGAAGGSGFHMGTSVEVSSITSGSTATEKMPDKVQSGRKMEKTGGGQAKKPGGPSGKRGSIVGESSKGPPGLPIITEKSGPPSEISFS